MARKVTKGAQVHPEGPLIFVDVDQRAAIKNERERRGWEQKQLAEKAGVTPATISNLEGTRSKQVRKVVYVKVLKALRIPDTTTDDAAIIGETVDLLVALKSADVQTIRDLARSFANRSKKPG